MRGRLLEIGAALLFLGLGLLGELAQHFGGLEQRLRLGQQVRELLGLLDRGGADQRRLAAAVGVGDRLDQRERLLVARAEHLVVLVLAGDGHVGGDLDHLEPVDRAELLRLGHRGAGHARELAVKAEQVLEGDRGQRHVLGLDLGAFLGLQRLVEAVAEAPAVHHPAGELVDDHHLGVAHDVMCVLAEQLVGAQGLVDVVDVGDVLGIVESGALGQQACGLQALLDELVALVGEVGRAGLLVDVEMLVADLGDDRVDGAVGLRAVLGGARDDQGRARLVDQDRVDLVHDGEGVAALDHVLEPELHVVAQVVEPELVVRAVGDVAGVGGFAVRVADARGHDAGGQAEEAVDLAHPLGVAAGEVVVHGDDVDALAGDGVEVGGQDRDQRLALAGLHLRDLALMEDHAAHQLHVEGPHAERALGAFARHGEGLGQQVVEGLALGVTVPELLRLGAERLIGEGGKLGFEVVDRAHLAHQRLDLSVVRGPEDLPGGGAQSQHVSPSS